MRLKDLVEYIVIGLLVLYATHQFTLPVYREFRYRVQTTIHQWEAMTK